MTDNEFWLKFWTRMVLAIIFTILAINIGLFYRDKQMLDAGYVYTKTVSGYMNTWVKTGNKLEANKYGKIH